MNFYRIKSYLSYFAILMAIFFYFSSFEDKNIYAIICASVFTIFRFGEKLSGALFSLTFLVLLSLYYYDPSLINWKYFGLAGILILVSFLLGRSPKKIDFLGSNKGKNCPRCNGTGKQVYHLNGYRNSSTENCTFCNGSGKFSM